MNVRLVTFFGFVFAVALLPPSRLNLGVISARQARVDAQKPAAHYATHSHARILRASSLAWQPEKSLPPGAESVVLEGDPSKPGLVILRLKMPDGYRVPPVWHPAADRFTVLSGTYHLGVGAKFDGSKTVALSRGRFCMAESRCSALRLVHRRNRARNHRTWSLRYKSCELPRGFPTEEVIAENLVCSGNWLSLSPTLGFVERLNHQFQGARNSLDSR